MLCKATWYLNHLKSEIDTSILSAHWTHVWVVLPWLTWLHSNELRTPISSTPILARGCREGQACKVTSNILCGISIHFKALMQSSMTQLWGSLHIPYCYFFTATMFKCFLVAYAVFSPASSIAVSESMFTIPHPSSRKDPSFETFEASRAAKPRRSSTTAWRCNNKKNTNLKKYGSRRFKRQNGWVAFSPSFGDGAFTWIWIMVHKKS